MNADRGQTTLDFLIGTATFLIAVGLIVAFVPGMIDPFATGSEGNAITANRAVNSLSQDQLSGPESPYVLDDAAVASFFGKNESEARDALGLSDGVRINITMENETAQIRSIGPDPPDTASITSAWRVVEYDSERAEIVVRVW